MDSELKLAIEQCRQELATSGDFSVASRYKIWCAYGPFLGKRPKNRAIIVDGLVRRCVLGAYCVQRVFPQCEQLLTESAAAAAAQDVLPNVRFVVENLLEATKAYLLGTIEATPAARVLDEGWTYGENQLVYLWDYGFSERQFAVAVCFASCGVLGIALNDERVQALSNETWDPYLADTAMFCANAASRGRPGELEMDLKLRQEFWEWYLSTAVPAASMVDRKSLFGVDFTLPNTVT